MYLSGMGYLIVGGNKYKSILYAIGIAAFNALGGLLTLNMALPDNC